MRYRNPASRWIQMATLKRNRTHSLGVRIWEPSDENKEKRTPSPQRWALLEDIAAGMLTPQEMAENKTLQLRIYCITPTLTVLKSTLSATGTLREYGRN